ncbi:L,D-transpeptidase [Coxiella burnetii]|uniref:L,D-transpeptidase n=1 Tax=Coxiella burnetii TaxID=777 RepID=UPI000183CF86|nr:L,D-transpeptidase [Coxiella burnetii]ACJ18266.1 enhanced entry protein [Coxiella burnetii CbuG_Q212]ATN66653.1 endopeptidase IV [Coxiella burnetii]OYK86409.1 murein L,D-transpeptidase [Coxiella burnetii]
MMKYLNLRKIFLTAVSALLISSCSSSLHAPASSTQGYLGRPKFFPAESAKSFYGRELCHAKGYHCIKIKMGDTWQKLFPDEKERQLVMRLNRMNMPVSLRPWILVPDNLSEITYHDVSPLPLKLNTKGKKLLLINLREHAFAAYDPQGNLVHWGPISAGKGICADGENCETVTGKFRIFRVHGENCKSGKYPIETNGGAPMLYCMFFYRGWAIHGSTLPGYHNSHGCVRLFHEDAKWLNQFFIKIGTTIHVAS